jgi:transposase
LLIKSFVQKSLKGKRRSAMSGLSVAAYFPFTRVKVVAQAVHSDSQGALLRLEPDHRFRPICHACGRPADGIHSAGHRRHIRDLALADRQVWLQVNYRKVWCASCAKARVEHLEFADASQRITLRLARYVYELCQLMTVSEVARHLGLDRKTVTAIEYAGLKEEFGVTDYAGLRVLAIDEISLHKGQRGYMTVVLDYETGRVVWMGEGRDKDALDAFFAGMTQAQKDGIQAVALDMWEAFINRIQHHCPQAQIVFDLFHLVKAFGEVIDEVRRHEYRTARKQDRSVIKGSRYLLLSNVENLRPDQQASLERLLATNQRLNAVYVLKDQLKVLYHYSRRAWAKRALDSWCAMAEDVDHPLMRRFIGRLRFFEYGILNHCEHPIGTSPLEGVNNKIKLIKRKGYGYHDPEHFALKTKQAFPGRESVN